MNIGVVTLSESRSNYGNVLQYLATQTFLEKRGHEVSLLVNTERKSIKATVRKCLVNTPLYSLYLAFAHKRISEEDKQRGEKFKRQSEVDKRQEMLHPRHFDEFRQRYFHIMKAKLRNDKRMDEFDCLVSGSDQIWCNYSWYGFLDFGLRDAKRLSIAPSCGNHRIDDDKIADVARQLQKYSFITVREEDGLDLCRRAGRNDAQVLLDPTFLLSASDYVHYEEPVSDTDSPYVLLYLLGADVAIDVAEIYHFAKANGMKVKYVASQGRDDDYEKIYPTVGQWLYLVNHAATVITNSFHGTAFSIIYRRKFLALPVIGALKAMNMRFDSLLGRLGMEERFCDKDLGVALNDIDYSKAERIIEDNKRQLESLLSSCGL